jgi:putative flavoprotein involved in K+ transport
MPPTEASIVVVGAGAAGLGTAAMLARSGHEVVVVDEDDRVGGRWARRYDRLQLHTVRRFSGLPDRPLPRALPRYVSKDDYADYLEGYAAAFQLDIRLRTRSDRIVPGNERWLVRTSRGDYSAAVVIVATGKHNRKRVPTWPGVEDFAGELVHSADYRSAEPYAGRRALVIGIGNSGAEIATDLVDGNAASVAIAVRTSPPIARREIAGIPVQLFGILLSPFPAKPVDRLGAVVRRIGTGDLGRYGLGREAWGPFEARRPPLIDVGFLATLKRGAIAVKPEVTALTRTGVVFADGTEERYDVVVAATGFSTGLEELLEMPDFLDDHGLPTAGREYAGLYFVGFSESPRGALYEANRDSQRLAGEVSRYLAGRRAAGSSTKPASDSRSSGRSGS